MSDNQNGKSHSIFAINLTLQQQLQALLTDLQLDDAPAGGALVVYQAGVCIAQASIGMAQADMKWQADTLSLNFSTGKGVLATLVHVLVSQKRLAYDVPIASYWSAFAACGKSDITLRAVLSHQADLFAIDSIQVDNATLLHWEEMVAHVAAMPRTPPSADERYAKAYDSAYSALIYGWVLGGLIESVTDMTLADALRYYLTAPLGIADSCYFGVPNHKINSVAKLVKDFDGLSVDGSPLRRKRHKPILKVDSAQTLDTYSSLPSYQCWQQLKAECPLASASSAPLVSLNSIQINRLYFNHSAINANNYRAALIPASKQPIDYYDKQVMQAVIPAANGIASAQALAIIYAMLANGGTWQGKTLIDASTFEQLSTLQVTGMDAVMPAQMGWRLGYHRLFSVCQNDVEQGFGHMGYNGSVAWCEPERQLSFAFVHNFDVTLMNDVRQFALTEAVLAMT